MVRASLSELGFDVIAEGVEKEEEVELLGRWGVDKIQGYYYARPARARRDQRDRHPGGTKLIRIIQDPEQNVSANRI